jgi:hypothetical protein
MSSELQKVGDISFRIWDENMDMRFLWKDGELYLTLHTVMLTDGNAWYEIPIKDLRNIEVVDERTVRFVVDKMNLSIKGKRAERLLALRHLLLPLIEGETERDIEEGVLKLMLLDIDDPMIISSLLKKDAEEVRAAILKAEMKGFIHDGKVTEKGMRSLPEEDIKLLEKVGGPE